MSSNKESLSKHHSRLKGFTSKKIFDAIKSNPRESSGALAYEEVDKIWFWEEGYHGEEIFSQKFFDTQLHLFNPVRAGLVEKEEEYLCSSCGEIMDLKRDC